MVHTTTATPCSYAAWPLSKLGVLEVQHPSHYADWAQQNGISAWLDTKHYFSKFYDGFLATLSMEFLLLKF